MNPYKRHGTLLGFCNELCSTVALWPTGIKEKWKAITLSRHHRVPRRRTWSRHRCVCMCVCLLGRNGIMRTGHSSGSPADRILLFICKMCSTALTSHAVAGMFVWVWSKIEPRCTRFQTSGTHGRQGCRKDWIIPFSHIPGTSFWYGPGIITSSFVYESVCTRVCQYYLTKLILGWMYLLAVCLCLLWILFSTLCVFPHIAVLHPAIL